jgi:hypothetical protein
MLQFACPRPRPSLRRRDQTVVVFGPEFQRIPSRAQGQTSGLAQAWLKDTGRLLRSRAYSTVYVALRRKATLGCA